MVSHGQMWGDPKYLKLNSSQSGCGGLAFAFPFKYSPAQDWLIKREGDTDRSHSGNVFPRF